MLQILFSSSYLLIKNNDILEDVHVVKILPRAALSNRTL